MRVIFKGTEPREVYKDGIHLGRVVTRFQKIEGSNYNHIFEPLNGKSKGFASLTKLRKFIETEV